MIFTLFRYFCTDFYRSNVFLKRLLSSLRIFARIFTVLTYFWTAFRSSWMFWMSIFADCLSAHRIIRFGFYIFYIQIPQASRWDLRRASETDGGASCAPSRCWAPGPVQSVCMWWTFALFSDLKMPNNLATCMSLEGVFHDSPAAAHRCKSHRTNRELPSNPTILQMSSNVIKYLQITCNKFTFVWIPSTWKWKIMKFHEFTQI